GSTIHTRLLPRRSSVSLLSSESRPSSGRCSRRAWQRNWFAVASPALPSALVDRTSAARTSISSFPATSARWAASSASVIFASSYAGGGIVFFPLRAPADRAPDPLVEIIQQDLGDHLGRSDRSGGLDVAGEQPAQHEG